LKAFFSYARPRPPIKKQHHIKDIIHEVSVLLAKRIASHNIQFEEKFEENLKPVCVDLNQIQQVFLNLFINALEAMVDGGKLQISAKNIITRQIRMDRRGRSYSEPQKESPFVEIVLSDTGVGIRPEHVNTIFDPFFTTKPQGTGLGLSIVYRIIEEHGGEISVTSQLEKGSQFKILLPAEE
jgi:signal transduction histidine kinase